MNTIFKNENLLVIDKPAGISVYAEEKNALMNEVIKEFPDLKEVGEPPRYGLIHRLDKETSGILLIARNKKALNFFQKQFKERKVVKKYLALVKGEVEYEKTIKSLIGRALKNRTTQKAYLPHSPEAKKRNLRKAVTEIKPIQKFKDYTLIEAFPRTGRKHQIRVHLKFINHPVVGDKTYNFKNQKNPFKLDRHFLHSHYLKISLLDQEEKEFHSELPQGLKEIIKKLKYE